MELYFATSNKNKFNEVKDILSNSGFDVKQVEIDIIEIRSDKIEEISIEKAKFAFERIKKPILVEDSGLFVDCLNGFPGPYTNFSLTRIGNNGLLRLIEEDVDRAAEAKLTFSYFDGKDVLTISHVIKGKISKKERGEAGFGWDKVFIPEGEERTFAEMEPKEKNTRWRGAALKTFVEKYKT